MKILLVSPFDFGYPGGVNEHIMHLDREFRALGHQTRILAPRSDEEGEEDDGHIYRLGLAVPVPSNGSTARITLSPLISGKVKEFLHDEDFDIIHLHEPLAPTLPLMVLLHSKTVNIGTFHAARSSNLAYLYGKPLLSFFHGKLHARIAVSPSAEEFVSQYFPAVYEIIPNGIDIEQFGPHVPKIHHPHISGPTVLFVGRYNESRKGLKYLLRAIALVRQEFPGVHLLVVGPGQAWRYDRLLERYELDNVTFVGAVSKQDLPSYYASADVFCAPSTGRESFGIVLLEAMASGRPVVATNIDGYTAVVRHGVEGLLVEPKNPEALALALVHVLADRELAARLGEAGRRRAEEHSWSVIARRVLDVYERALDRYGRYMRPTKARALRDARVAG
ncbi:glycosyltransferase family 4 protein [Sphaerobacter sp.]|uniref:glycosyltransferase family 4 protein n=1 Tax=Sphaerobacter sp. TaxID=2099654 RepID=UPI001DC1C20E|nr:glycosyltransferase family 4 protein [Sphaerobacter sp.]MBX5443854.1 glycosyltransferase family 4 protein [Sphaerobacter sp.]